MYGTAGSKPKESQRKELIQITWALKALLSPGMPNNFVPRPTIPTVK